MSGEIEVYPGQAIGPYTQGDFITVLADQWLAAKAGRSGSHKTARAYRDALRSFRLMLVERGLDLLELVADGSVRAARAVAFHAQDWASQPATGVHQGRDVTPATYNQKLAILSSFYSYAIRQSITDQNPISRVERRPVQGYAQAIPLEASHVRRRLKAIDRTGVIGQRDYVLLAVALETGRRVSELAALRVGDVQFSDGRAQILWRRAKGGKVMRDRLPVAVSRALLEYLQAVYGAELSSLLPDTPVWISLSRRNRGQAMTPQTIADVCQNRLGTSKVHTLRHTFAHAMEQAGARVSDIQARLGHESLATTGRYLAALGSAENAHADDLAAMFGLNDE